MNDVTRQALSKVPAVTLGFWVIKILATTLGETGGDTVTMTLDWGYLAGVMLFGALLVTLVVAQISAKRFYPILYWATIVASTTFGTTLADFADRSLGIGYTGGSVLLLCCLLATLGLWHRSAGTVSVNTVATPKVEAFYWATITFSQTLGTALGDWLADTRGFGYERGALVFTVIGRICPWEIAHYLRRRRLQRVKVRFARDVVPVSMNNHTIWTKYYSPREFYRAFRSDFTLESYRGFCVFAPPPYLTWIRERHLRWYQRLWRMDRRMAGWPVLREFGDHFLIVMRRR